MKVYDEDLILNRAFQGALDTGPPQPSWSDIEAREGAFTPRWQRRRLKVALAYAAVLLAIAVPALAYAAHSVFFKSAPGPFQSLVDSFAGIGGPSGTPANKPAVVAQPRRVLTIRLSNGGTAALWVAPTVDSAVAVPWFAPTVHHYDYCFDTQVVNGDPNAPGTGFAWGGGYMGNPGCGKHERALDVGYDIENYPPVARIVGGSGLRDAHSVEVRYQDGSATRAPTVYVSSPVDASFFMFQIPVNHTTPGSRPKELILRARDGSILARDKGIFSSLWRAYGQMGVGSSASSRPNSPRYQLRATDNSTAPPPPDTPMPPLASSSRVTSGPTRSLAVTLKLQNQLRAAFVANHRDKKAAEIDGPMKGTIHYGRYRNREYALADFSIPYFLTVGQPEVFSRAVGGRWVDRGESGGSVCTDTVPLPLLKAWKLFNSGEAVVGGRTVLCFG